MAKHDSSMMIGLAVLAIGGYLYYQEQKKKQANTNNAPAGSTTTTGNNLPKGSAYDYPILPNHYSEAAKLLQHAVGVKEDGFIGPSTLAAIQKLLPLFPSNFSIPNRAFVDDMIRQMDASRAQHSVQDMFLTD